MNSKLFSRQFLRLQLEVFGFIYQKQLNDNERFRSRHSPQFSVPGVPTTVPPQQQPSRLLVENVKPTTVPPQLQPSRLLVENVKRSGYRYGIRTRTYFFYRYGTL